MVAVGAAENAVDNGAEVRVNTRVVAISKKSEGFEVTAETPDGNIKLSCTAVVNAAGGYADEISAMVTTPDYKITGRRGHYILLDKASRTLVNNILFPCPTALGKGMLILPEIHGRIMLGPDASDVSDKSDVRTTAEGIALVKKTVAGYLRVPIPYGLMIRTFSGVRPVPSTGDFIVRECPGIPGFIEAAGIESPGLASAPAISRKVAALAVESIGGAPQNAGFNPSRRAYMPHNHDPKSAHIVCRCEKVSEAEVVDAIHRNCGARTVKGVKLRTGAGAGGCQSGFCQPSIVNILARELGIDKTEVLYDGPGSNILTGKTRGGAENA
jgi:glycerol-3-phosphate dehydrogenase